MNPVNSCALHANLTAATCLLWSGYQPYTHHALSYRGVQVVALHMEHYVFPVNINVTKVSGSGADAVFMGVLKPLPAAQDVVQAWVVPSGM